MLTGRMLKSILYSLLLCSSLPLLGQGGNFVLTTAPSNVQQACGNHGLQQVSTIWNNSTTGVYLVSSASSPDPTIATDTTILSFESNQSLGVPELSGATNASLVQSTSGILETLPGRSIVSYFGVNVPSNYVQQPATAIVNLAQAQALKLSGSGITVAIIDTGVDPNHPALKPVLINGFDFTRNQSGASEIIDLDPTTQASLVQSTSGILEGVNVVQMNSFIAAILSQSTSGILEGNVPKTFGHGTMTAGIVHLIAPGARIMPLKAFRADGSSDLFNILRAIYYAADNGANVISMSFEIPASSPGLQNAIQYALNKNVTVIAASGNDGAQILVYPAAYNMVVGVGSTSNTDSKSVFTNYGTNSVFAAAPGEGVITTYPGNNDYAAGWGTSFSTPIVAGEAALILQAKPGYHPGDVANGISRGVLVQMMGHGRVDFCQAIGSIGIGFTCTTSTTGTSGGSGTTTTTGTSGGSGTSTTTSTTSGTSGSTSGGSTTTP